MRSKNTNSDTRNYEVFVSDKFNGGQTLITVAATCHRDAYNRVCRAHDVVVISTRLIKAT